MIMVALPTKNTVASAGSGMVSPLSQDFRLRKPPQITRKWGVVAGPCNVRTSLRIYDIETGRTATEKTLIEPGNESRVLNLAAISRE
ncbi:hypothetical protein GCM10023074_27660 [Microbispora amethystogenes]|uniref:Uncharacterized protein n=1 Tax=Microbispora amethystogenes TaxID=1427754 RepID=A0ABQ4F9Q1_9ACTN|nr:hypothetical protein Mam01_17130 [Microbispora amethystogenes]